MSVLEAKMGSLAHVKWDFNFNLTVRFHERVTAKQLGNKKLEVHVSTHLGELERVLVAGEFRALKQFLQDLFQ